MARAIELTKGFVTWVDDEDYERVARVKWHAVATNPNSEGPTRYYARRDCGKGSSPRIVYMHNVLCPVPPGLENDHRDGDGLNNRKVNIRAGTRGNNMANRRSWSGSGYKGVSKLKGKWSARITHDQRTLYLGSYADAVSAARVYDCKATELHREFAYLNFPTNDVIASHSVRHA